MRSDPAIFVQDLAWVAAALDINIRCTIKADVYDKVREHFPGVKQDSIFGNNPSSDVYAHLHFAWVDDATGGRKMGHFDLLIPTAGGTMRLPPDAALTWEAYTFYVLEFAAPFCVEIPHSVWTLAFILLE